MLRTNWNSTKRK